MAETKIISYRQWRNSIEKKGYSYHDELSDESLQRIHKFSNTIKLEGRAMHFQQEARLTMVKLNKKQNGKNEIRMIQSLIKLCKKEKVFRSQQVEKIKRLIKANKYHVPGKIVANKWFSEDSVT
ncbi:hypothetical protein KAR34_03230 [bacterium]|nr:hypothetical protein [bacterium]